MPLKGKDNGQWKDASAVYGKSGGSWLYAKEAFAKQNGEWKRAWTDCRLFDAGGRDWSSPTTTSSYFGSCLSRTRTDTTTRTKTGCPNDVRSSTVSDPTCGTVDCYSDVTQSYLNAYGTFTAFTFAGKSMFLYTDCANNLWANYLSASDDPCYQAGTGCPRARLLTCSTNQYIDFTGCGDCGIFC